MKILKPTLSLIAALLSVTVFAGDGKMSADQKYYRADEIRGYDVFGSQGLKVGDITDFALSLENDGAIEYVIITTGGFADLFGAERAVPVDAIRFEDGSYRLNVIKQNFLKAPVLRSATTRELTSPIMQDRLATLYNVQKPHGKESSKTSSDLVLWSEIMNDEVTLDNREVGVVENALVNLNDGKLAYVFVRPLRNTMFYSSMEQRYAVPTTDVEETKWQEIELTLSADDLLDATALDETINITRDASDRGVVYKFM